MGLVAPNLDDVAISFAADLDLESAVALTQNAGGGVPIRAFALRGRRHRVFLPLLTC